MPIELSVLSGYSHRDVILSRHDSILSCYCFFKILLIQKYLVIFSYLVVLCPIMFVQHAL